MCRAPLPAYRQMWQTQPSAAHRTDARARANLETCKAGVGLRIKHTKVQPKVAPVGKPFHRRRQNQVMRAHRPAFWPTPPDVIGGNGAVTQEQHRHDRCRADLMKPAALLDIAWPVRIDDPQARFDELSQHRAVQTGASMHQTDPPLTALGAALSALAVALSAGAILVVVRTL